MLDGEVVSQLRYITIGDLCGYTTLRATDAPTLLAQFGLLDSLLQAVFAVGV